MERSPSIRRQGSRRRSLQEGSVTKRSTRRLERHSAHAAPPPFEVSLLGYLHVKFVKAFVPASKLSRPRYVMQVTNVALQQTWEMVRPFKEFYEMKEELLRALDHGHLCQSNCPWIYMFVTHHFPRRHFFRSRQPTVVASRLSELETFLNTLLRVMKENRNLGCNISAQALPKILFDFLFEGMVFNRTDFDNTILEDRVSIGIAPLELTSAAPEEQCTICQRALKHSESSLSLTTTRTAASSTTESESDGGSSSHTALSIVSLTTLECGHRFHDECILEKLNKDLQCPLCREEAKLAAKVAAIA